MSPTVETSSEAGPTTAQARSSGRVFCIGFQKTGTCSMMAALRQVGYRVAGNRDDLVDPIRDRDIRPIDQVVERFAAFEDNPWPVLFRLLDDRYPGSRFILTVRDEDRWYASILNHFGVFGQRLMRLVYGKRNPAGNEALYRARFRSHNDEVRAYFRDRPDDLLVMNLSEGDGWPELCRFLGTAVIEGPFPHRNERSYSSTISWINKVCTGTIVLFQSALARLGIKGGDVHPPPSIHWDVSPRFDLPTPPRHEGAF